MSEAWSAERLVIPRSAGPIPGYLFISRVPLVSEKLGKLIVNAQLINDEQLQKPCWSKRKRGRLGSILVRLGFMDEAKLLKFLSQQYGVPAADLTKIEIDPTVVKLVPAEVVKKYLVVPIKRMGATLSLAMVDPSDVFAIDDIKFMTGYNVEPIIAAESSVVELINKYYGKGLWPSSKNDDNRSQRLYPLGRRYTKSLPRPG